MKSKRAYFKSSGGFTALLVLASRSHTLARSIAVQRFSRRVTGSIDFSLYSKSPSMIYLPFSLPFMLLCNISYPFLSFSCDYLISFGIIYLLFYGLLPTVCCSELTALEFGLLLDRRVALAELEALALLLVAATAAQLLDPGALVTWPAWRSSSDPPPPQSPLLLTPIAHRRDRNTKKQRGRSAASKLFLCVPVSSVRYRG